MFVSAVRLGGLQGISLAVDKKPGSAVGLEVWKFAFLRSEIDGTKNEVCFGHERGAYGRSRLHLTGVVSLSIFWVTSALGGRSGLGARGASERCFWGVDEFGLVGVGYGADGFGTVAGMMAGSVGF